MDSKPNNMTAISPSTENDDIKGNNQDKKAQSPVDYPTYTVEEAVEIAGLGWFQVKLVLICGVLTAADAMEMLLLSILGPALRCQWHLNPNEIATITTVVFVGFLVGSPMWGYISDRFGRWPTFFTVLSLISYFGFLTALSPTYIWLIILRFAVGFAIGGGHTSFTLLSEFLPLKNRAKVLVSFQVFWALGSTLEVGMAYLILPRFGWRWLVFASAVPMILFLILLTWLPESPRFLLAAGRTEQAEAIVRQLIRVNKAKQPEGRLSPNRILDEKRGSVKELFSRNYRATTLMLPFIWFGAAFIYYGVVLLSAEIFRFLHTCYGERYPIINFHGTHAAGNTSMVTEITLVPDNSCCQELTNDDYLAMIVSALGEFAGILFMVLVIDCFGRRICLGVLNLLAGLLFFTLYICMPKDAMTALLFLLRAVSGQLLNLDYVYTIEAYPTTVRAVAVGSYSSIARVGAMTTPYVAQVMLPEVSEIGALSLYAAVGLVCSALSFTLPIETAGRPMPNDSETEVILE